MGVRQPDVPRILWDQLISQSRPCATDVCRVFIMHHEAINHRTALITGNHCTVSFNAKSSRSQHKVIPALDVCEKIKVYLLSIVP